MAYLFKRGSVYYVKFYVAGKQKEKSLGTGIFQIAKEKQRLFESARAKGENLPMPTRTPIADIVTAYVAQIRTAKTAKSAQTDIYYLRDVFGPVCDAPENHQPEGVGKEPQAPVERRCGPPAQIAGD